MRVRATLAAVLLLLAAGCGDSAGAEPGGGPVTVLAAASLTESFTRVGEAFERDHPGADVTFSFGGSSGLAQQIVSGAPADVFAAASPATMKTVTDAGGVAGEPVLFARNQLVIAVPKGNPRRITTLAALAGRGTKVALCAAQVPCGSAAAKALAAAGVDVTPVTLEQDVRAALAKVKLGEVDAALVYRTDARAAAADVDGVEFGESAAAINDYPIAVLADAPNRSRADAFVAFVRGPAGQRILADAGFQRP
jgi:molybdate transport system substrate-binding protein